MSALFSDLGHALAWPRSLLPVAVAFAGSPRTPDAVPLLELGVQRLALLGLRPIWAMSGEHGDVDQAAQAFAAAADLPRAPLPASWLTPGACTWADPVPVGALVAVWDRQHARTAQLIHAAKARALPVVLVLSGEAAAAPARVVNVQAGLDAWDTYAGRRMLQRLAITGSTDGALGNPWRVGVDGTRGEVGARWTAHFLARMAGTSPADLGFQLRVEAMRGHRIACWCAPGTCHCDLYAAVLNGDHALLQARLDPLAWLPPKTPEAQLDLFLRTGR